jgi:hypothetical protein
MCIIIVYGHFVDRSKVIWLETVSCFNTWSVVSCVVDDLDIAEKMTKDKMTLDQITLDKMTKQTELTKWLFTKCR